MTVAGNKVIGNRKFGDGQIKLLSALVKKLEQREYSII